MNRYRKGKNTKAALLSTPPKPSVVAFDYGPPGEKKWMLGMLFTCQVSLHRARTGERITHKVLMIGCEVDDIERKLRWMFAKNEFDEFAITKIERVKEKVHILSTVVTQDPPPMHAIIDRDDRSQTIPYPASTERDADQSYRIFALGVATKMPATDELHAMRKVGRALVAMGNSLPSESAPRLSDDAVVTVEPISRSSGHAKPRDVSELKARAHIVRG